MNLYSKPEATRGDAHADAGDAIRQPAQARPEAILLPFPAADARGRRRTLPVDGRRGEILFFLGVRYERLAS